MIFVFKSSGWVRSSTLSGKYESPGAEQNQEAARALLTAIVNVRWPFISDQVVCMHVFFFYLDTPRHKQSRKNTQPRMIAAVIRDLWLAETEREGKLRHL
jgi:hypothetical protein